jgi:hypothetical protein
MTCMYHALSELTPPETDEHLFLAIYFTGDQIFVSG